MLQKLPKGRIDLIKADAILKKFGNELKVLIKKGGKGTVHNKLKNVLKMLKYCMKK